MKSLTLLITLTAIAATPALAQQSPQSAPPGTQQGTPGSAQQSSEFRDRAAEPPKTATPHSSTHRHPGTVRKLNTGSAGSPEVQFDLDRRAASEAAKQSAHR